MTSAITERINRLDWSSLRDSLFECGYALAPVLLSADECTNLASLYRLEENFRSHIIMSRYRFGRGDYKYFKYPLPSLVQELRDQTYSHLAPVANHWNELLRLDGVFPPRHRDFLKLCQKHGQTRPTPLLLHYEAEDFNCLHQDIYGDVAFAFQATCFLSQPGADYEGGEFVLVEQQPRAQSKAEVIVANRGQMLIFATRFRPVKGNRGHYRTSLKHGVSRLKRGVRFTLGIIYHDSQKARGAEPVACPGAGTRAEAQESLSLLKPVASNNFSRPK
jgi:uncharacterized protein